MHYSGCYDPNVSAVISVQLRGIYYQGTHSPYILHLAMHGFFASEDNSDTRATELQPVSLQASVFKSKFFNNPMHRSGLALAGAQATLKAWEKGEAPLVENDGIVTAEDVSTLDLQGTWLVTLSACDTGSGGLWGALVQIS